MRDVIWTLLHPIQAYQNRRNRRLRVALIAAEVVVDGPERAMFAVRQLDGSVRWVAERLFARDGDMAAGRSTPLFAAMAEEPSVALTRPA